MKKIFLKLGKQPLANSFLPNLRKKTLNKEFFYNLNICFDTKKFLVSITKPVNPKSQYTDKYSHRASEAKTIRNAFKKIAHILNKKYNPKLVMEIGSNDGVFLKNFNSKKVIAVEPKNSAVLSGKKPGRHAIQGIGASFLPSVLNKNIYEKVITISDYEAQEMSDRLAKESGLLVGISSGANVAAALKYGFAEKKTQKIVTILCDTGERYLSVGE